MILPTFVDIDGTLTSEPHAAGGPVHADRIAVLRELIASGEEVVVWSARGTAYAQQFCRNHDLNVVAIGKPDLCVDDKPTIRAAGLKVVSPEAFFE